MTHYRNIIIGSGQGGNPLASYLSGKGEPTLLIEKSKLGGTCVNTGCTPSKTLYESTRKIYHSHKLEYAGFNLQDVAFDFGTLMNFVRKVAGQSNKGLSESFAQAKNLTISFGHARFTGTRQILVTHRNGRETEFSGDRIFINTGSKPRLPEIDGLHKIDYLTNLNVFDLEKQPESLAIIGGGYIGMELAQCFTRLGTKVSVINHGPQIISHEDDDIIELVQKRLTEEGVKFFLNEKVESVKKEGKGIELLLGSGKKLSTEKLLLAAGRISNADELQPHEPGIALNKNGYIKVNEYLETSAENVWALGEAAGSPKFTHISFDDFRVIRDNLEQPKSHSTKNRVVPYTMFIDPELASFGLNEKQARKKGTAYHLYEMEMSAVARATERNETYGKIKVLCDKKGGQILGATILSIGGGEMMTLLQMVAKGGITASELKHTIFAHPLLAESLNNLF